MKRSIKAFALLITASAPFELPANAAQPPEVGVSDQENNTAMGTNALLSLTGGIENTAAGVQALVKTTTCNDNTAFGTYDLQFNEHVIDNTSIGITALVLNTSGYL